MIHNPTPIGPYTTQLRELVDALEEWHQAGHDEFDGDESLERMVAAVKRLDVALEKLPDDFTVHVEEEIRGSVDDMLSGPFVTLLHHHASTLLFRETLLPRQLTDEEQTKLIEDLTPRRRTAHVLWCIEEILKAGPGPRRSRWLGFVQGALWGLGFVSIRQLRDQTRAAIAESKEER